MMDAQNVATQVGQGELVVDDAEAAEPGNIWNPDTLDKKVYTSTYVGYWTIYHAL